MGPTASGKTDLALSLASKLPIELISVDSVMIYRGMNIGAAKPSPEILREFPHHLVDILDIPEPYSAARFSADARALIEVIFKRGKIPLLVGGTMLYFRALQQGLSPLPDADEAVRAQIEAEAAEQGWSAMHAQLKVIDSEAATKIHPNDPQRLSRALEVYRLTGTPLSILQQKKETNLGHSWLNLALFPARQLLHDRIESRFKQMLALGLIEEVESLLHQWSEAAHYPAMRAVGYRQVLDYLTGHIHKNDLLMKGVAATRQLAKRQCTWLRSWPEVHLLQPEDIHKFLGSVTF